MSLISLDKVSKSFGSNQLFNDLTLHIEPKERLGLIGPNGAGKSTLLRILAGIEKVDSGERHCIAQLKLILVDQANNLNSEKTILEEVLNQCGNEKDILIQFNNLTKDINNNPDSKLLLDQINKLNNLMDYHNVWSLEQRCIAILQQLGINDLNRRVSELSGGLHKRLALAASLVAEPEIILLDEPTNHLDVQTIAWLEKWLNNFSGAVIIVTHDRYVLQRVTNRIIEVSEGAARIYPGSYESYLKYKSIQIEVDKIHAIKLKVIMQKELAWLEKGAKARSTKQKARINRIESMKKGSNYLTQKEEKASEFFSINRRIGKVAIETQNLGVTCDGNINSPILLKNFNYSFKPEDRIGIVGPNGIGKSTFLDLIAGIRPATRGSLEIGSTVQIAYFDQCAEDLLHKNQCKIKAIDFIKESASRIQISGVSLTASQFLEYFSFSPARQHTSIGNLSGGEKRRLYLCRLLIESPNVLLLDEPTNDFDIQTLTMIEDLLENFAGCIIIVSHDRYFLDRVVNRILFFEQTRLRCFEGNYNDFIIYQAEKESIYKQVTEDFKRLDAKINKQNIITNKIQITFKQKQELNELNKQLPQWEKRRYELEELLTKNYQLKILEILTDELSTLIKQISHGEDRWLILSDSLI